MRCGTWRLRCVRGCTTWPGRHHREPWPQPLPRSALRRPRPRRRPRRPPPHPVAHAAPTVRRTQNRSRRTVSRERLSHREAVRRFGLSRYSWRFIGPWRISTTSSASVVAQFEIDPRAAGSTEEMHCGVRRATPRGQLWILQGTACEVEREFAGR